MALKAAVKAPLAKPALAKPALAKPAAKPAKAAAKPKAAKPVKPPKEVKAFDIGGIVVFKGYTPQIDPATKAEIPNTTGTFTAGEELAVVGQMDRDGLAMIAVVKKADFHAFQADNNSVNGEEILVSEVKRTSKVVEAPFHMPVVGDMTSLLKQEGGDPLAIAQKLFSDISKSYFYLGGMFAKLYKEKDEESGASLFATYQNSEGKNYADTKEGFEAFLNDNFAEDLGGYRKVMDLIAIYESISSLPNVKEILVAMQGIGWWKAQKMARFITNDNAKEIIEVAKANNYDQMSEILKTSYTTAGGVNARGNPAARTAIKKVSFDFKLYEDQGEAVEMILKAAMKQMGSQDLNAVFEHIVTEWAGDHLEGIKEKAIAASTKKRNQLVKAGAKLPADHPNAAAPAAAAA